MSAELLAKVQEVVDKIGVIRRPEVAKTNLVLIDVQVVRDELTIRSPINELVFTPQILIYCAEGFDHPTVKMSAVEDREKGWDRIFGKSTTRARISFTDTGFGGRERHIIGSISHVECTDKYLRIETGSYYGYGTVTFSREDPENEIIPVFIVEPGFVDEQWCRVKSVSLPEGWRHYILGIPSIEQAKVGTETRLLSENREPPKEPTKKKISYGVRHPENRKNGPSSQDRKHRVKERQRAKDRANQKGKRGS